MPEIEVNHAASAEPETDSAAHSEPAPPRTLLERHPLARWILALTVLLVIVGGVLYWRHERVRESTDDAEIEGDVVPVAARIKGTVQQVLVDDNQQVSAGTVLVQFDRRDYQVALDKAEADFANAQARASAARTDVPINTTATRSNLEMAQANLRAAQKEVAAAQARLAEARARHQLAVADLARFRQLVQKDEISQQQYDAAASSEQALGAAAEAAQAAVAAAESHVAQAQAQARSAATAPQQIMVTRAQAGAAAAEVQIKAAAVDQAKLNLEYCTLRAAVAGVVTKKTVEPGQTVEPGAPLMALVPLEQVWVVANFKENQLHHMRVGQPVSIHVDAYDRDYRGHVNSIGAASAARTSLLPPENATGNFVKVVQRIPVKITFDRGQDSDHLLRPGMSAEPTVLTSQ